MASQLNVALTHKATWVIYVLGLFFDVTHWGLYWQTSGRRVQDLDVCTVLLAYPNTFNGGAVDFCGKMQKCY